MGTVATKSACGGGGARYGEAVVVDVPAPVEPLGVYPCSKAWGANDDSRELSLECDDGDSERFSDGASCCLS